MARGHQSGRRTTLSGGSGLAQQVRSRLGDDPTWQHLARNGSWICPYCLSSVRGTDATRAALGRSIESHLDRRCTGWQGGRGAVKPTEQILSRLAHEDISHLAATDPAWQVFDHEGYWYSPCSLQKVFSVRLIGGRFDSFTVQNMVAHLMTCEQYRAGQIHPADAVQRARDATVRAVQLTGNIRQLIEYPLWRYADAAARWVCPFCLDAISSVPLISAVDWELAPDRMAWHLAAECTAYVPERPEPKVEAQVRQVAGSEPRSPSRSGAAGDTSRSGLRIARSGSQQISGIRTPHTAMPINNRTPMPGTGRIATPLPGQRPAVQGHMPGTGRIATPLPGARQVTPPIAKRTETPEPPTARPVTARVAKPVTGRVAKPAQPTSDQGGTGDSLAGTIFDDYESSDAPTPQRESFSWMDAVEEASQQQEVHLDTDRAKARDVQVGLLGKIPEIPGYRFAARFEACHDVSGDFYEFVNLPDGRIGFAQGDVSGHGIQAGLIMSMAKKTLSIFAGSGGSPCDVLAQVNDSLVDDLGGRIFISMAYAILDPSLGTITWARAGHNPTVRFNQHTGEISELQPRGMVVGMKKGAIFKNSLQEETIQTRSGDTFLIYTDGINETMNRQNVEFGTDLLFEVVRRFAAEGPDTLLDRIMDSVRQFRGGSTASDDSTLLALTVD